MCRRSSVIVASLMLLAPSLSAAQNWKDSVTSQVKALITPANATSDRLRVTKPGTVLEVKVDGISASPGKDGTYLTNKVRDGQIEQAKGLAASLANKKTNRDYRVGEKVYMFDVDVNDDDIQLRLLSLETNQINVKGNTEQTRYKAVVKFEFPKDSLRTMEFAQIKKAISGVFQIQGDEAEAPKTVELGQTTAEVEQVMGKPESILKAGAKMIYVYKAIKVTFMDGKVSDIQ